MAGETRNVSSFPGFAAGAARLTAVPETFFTELLPAIDNLAEMKVTLYALWHLEKQEGDLRFIRFEDFAADRRLMAGLTGDSDETLATLVDGLERAVRRGSLLEARPPDAGIDAAVFLLNAPRGRAALRAWENGEWSPGEAVAPRLTLEDETPNIFRLYEENIGLLTPMIADALREAEQIFPMAWVEDAMRIAVQNNARSWRYIEKILQSWKDKGRDGTDRRDSEKGQLRYDQGEFGEFIEH